MRAIRIDHGGMVSENEDVFEEEDEISEDELEIEEEAEEELDDELEIDEEAVSVDEVIEAEDEADLSEDEFPPEDEEAPLDKILAERTGGSGLESPIDEEGDDSTVVALDTDDRLVAGDGIVAKRQGEFTCKSCFLVKHPSQLADPKRMLCRDCV